MQKPSASARCLYYRTESPTPLLSHEHAKAMFEALLPIDARGWPDPWTWWPEPVSIWGGSDTKMHRRFKLDTSDQNILEADCDTIYAVESVSAFAGCLLAGFFLDDHAVSLFPGGLSKLEAQKFAAVTDRFAYTKNHTPLQNHVEWLLLHTSLDADIPVLCWWSQSKTTFGVIDSVLSNAFIEVRRV